MGDTSALRPHIRALIERFARHVDIATRLEMLLDGSETEWMKLQLPHLDGDVIKVTVSPVVQEHRQQSATLRSLASEISAAFATTPAAPKEDDAFDALLAKWAQDGSTAASS